MTCSAEIGRVLYLLLLYYLVATLVEMAFYLKFILRNISNVATACEERISEPER